MNKVIISCLAAFWLMGCASPQVQQSREGEEDGQLREQLKKADEALKEARLMDAEILYREITSEHPDLPNVWLKLGNIYARQGRNEAAIRTYDEGLKYQRDDGRIWYNLAVIQMKEAIETLEDASRVLESDNAQLPRIELLHESLLNVSRPSGVSSDGL
ncbi:tetratricopeptide repeat protein [Halomonas sp. CUBES01]|uniref:tetratricopeptide repeat protein n=1 Tax=Halomonas sp. CUBES01 TaxID=2897340 RepID=UPI001E32B10E|nr:tetratricopeptide repeat protein [Halomonas sp. CUBES01]MEC4766142.1 tetratricopeptide repeat protein [Halomonas sp. CUBES01]